MAFLCRFLLLATLLGSLPGFSASGQSLPRMQRAAINRTHLTFVNGDTVQRFTTTRKQPSPRTDRMYYWQGPDHILRTLGAYNGYLLDGPYRLTDRTDRLLGSGTFRQGLKNGLWRRWRADGSLLSASHWRRGQQRGPTISSDANSQPLPSAPKTAPAATPPPAVAAAPHWWQFGRRKKLKAKTSTAPSVEGKQPTGGRKAKPAKGTTPPKSKEKQPASAPAIAPTPGS